MGEPQGWLFEPTFNRSVKVRASDERVTSDGGLLLLREADHRLGVIEHLAAQLHDPRRQDLIRYELVKKARWPREAVLDACRSVAGHLK